MEERDEVVISSSEFTRLNGQFLELKQNYYTLEEKHSNADRVEKELRNNVRNLEILVKQNEKDFEDQKKALKGTLKRMNGENEKMSSKFETERFKLNKEINDLKEKRKLDIARFKSGKNDSSGSRKVQNELNELKKERVSLITKCSEKDLKIDSMKDELNAALLRGDRLAEELDRISSHVEKERDNFANVMKERLDRNEAAEREAKESKGLLDGIRAALQGEREMRSSAEDSEKNVRSLLESEKANMSQLLDEEKAASSQLKSRMKESESFAEEQRERWKKEREGLLKDIDQLHGNIEKLENQLCEEKSHLEQTGKDLEEISLQLQVEKESREKAEIEARDAKRETTIQSKKGQQKIKDLQDQLRRYHESSKSGIKSNPQTPERSQDNPKTPLTPQIPHTPTIQDQSSFSSPNPSLAPSPIPKQIELQREVNSLAKALASLQEENWKLVEKVNFLEDSISLANEEIERKDEIIKRGLLGTKVSGRSTAEMDRDKFERTRNWKNASSFMSNLFGGRSGDNDLQGELTQKMEAVLEDTVLQNLQLQENVQTLADEVERLKQGRSTPSPSN